MKPFLTLLILFLFGVSSLSHAQKKPLKIGAETLIPFEYLESGKAKGINVALIDTLFKKMGIPYELVFGTDGNRAYDQIKSGKLDAILSISYKSDRLGYLWYPQGFENEQKPQNFMWASEYVFFTTKGKVDAYKALSLSDIKAKGLRVGVIDGVSYSEEFWNADLNVVIGKSDEDNYQKLQRGEIDLYITDKTIGRFTVKSMNLENEIGYLPQRIISKPYTIAFSTKSTHPDLETVKKQFFIELDLAKRSGLARKLFLEYLRD